MKTIETLVQDIYNVFQQPHEFSEERLERFGKFMAASVVNKVNPPERLPGLSMSQIGTKCNAKLWYKFNKPESAEGLPPEARIKFMYGDILEELLLFFAEEAGHSVTGRQTELNLHGIRGKRDAVIDGVVVDVKSASSIAFQKFHRGLTYEEDSFGYMDQLQGYLKASDDDPLVTDHGRAAFLVIDKTLGHITLDVHRRSDLSFEELAKQKLAAIAQKSPPKRHYELQEHGKSGNMKLCMECSYCEFKKACWPGVKTFLYSNGPVHLAVVKKTPDVPEARF